MSLTPEQYMALSALATVNFTIDDKNKPLDDIDIQAKIEFALDDKNGKEVDDNNTLDSPIGTALATLNDWQLIAFTPNTPSGFAAAAFQAPPGPNGEPGEIVFTFRGTEKETLADIITNLNIIFSNAGPGNPTQFEDAFDFFTETMSNVSSHSGYSFTGHSLGGGIAQYMTLQTAEEGKSVTFNAVGIGQIDSLSGIDPSEYNDYVTDYVNENDIIGNFGVQLGTTKFLQDSVSNRLASVTDEQATVYRSVLTAMATNPLFPKHIGVGILGSLGAYNTLKTGY